MNSVGIGNSIYLICLKNDLQIRLGVHFSEKNHFKTLFIN